MILDVPKKSTKYLNFSDQIRRKVFKIRTNRGRTLTGIGNNKFVICGNDSVDGDDNWIVYPLDGGKYVIVNQLYGGVLDIHYRNNHWMLYLKEYMSLPQQHWSFETVDTHLAYFKIRNLDRGIIIGKHVHDNTICASYTDIDDKDYHWTFEESGDMHLPIELPLEQIDSFPRYTNQNTYLPVKTRHRLIARTLLPTIILVQEALPLAQQLKESPYYILEKYQYWMKLNEVSLLPKEKKTITYTCGIPENIQNSLAKQLGITIQADSGVDFLLGFTGGMCHIKKRVITDLQMSESQTMEKLIANLETVTYYNPCVSDFLYSAKYILSTELVLKRMVQSHPKSNIEVDKWIYTDPQMIQTTVYSKGIEVKI